MAFAMRWAVPSSSVGMGESDTWARGGRPGSDGMDCAADGFGLAGAAVCASAGLAEGTSRNTSPASAAANALKARPSAVPAAMPASPQPEPCREPPPERRADSMGAGCAKVWRPDGNPGRSGEMPALLGGHVAKMPDQDCG